ncbi:MAG TPA: hypothetical protein VM427_10615 [Patescibacteria group bacterium]|nr:hypothetical protein [Patescibacteria group bacterium]
MASTDTRAGFRLPWSPDRQSNESSEGGSPDQTPAAGTWPSEDRAAPVDAIAGDPPEAASAPDTAVVEPITRRVAAEPGPAEPSPADGPTPSKKPSRFMADLTKAMQAAAEDARSRTISQLQADAKTHVETIHGRAATEAADLRHTADDDVAGVREWSKAEIARIREETETRITDRKARLEADIKQHAAVIEREVDAVQKTVAEFEEAMAAFFGRLLGEEDPSRFATMAENLPEPPAFDSLLVSLEAGEAETVGATDEPVESAEKVEEADPRFAALGLSPDYAAAEAEALADAGTSDEDVPEIRDDAFASRIAGLVAGPDGEAAAATQVVVAGLVSVASIASFKRHLGRLAGVRSVGVSSGPDGEFVFAVSHEAGVALHDALPALPTFQARVTSSSEGIVHVTAHDPESDG